MYKTFAKHLLAIAFVIYLIAAIITALLALAGGTIGILLGSFVSVVAAFVLQATLVKAVQDVRDGRADLSISQTVNQALPFLAPVAGASILAGIAITIGLLLIIVPGLFLITIWAVIVPVIVIERSGALASFGRSRQLVRGHGWHVFGTLVLVYIIMLVANIVLGFIFTALPHVLGDGLSSVISGHADLPVPRHRRHARVLPAGRHLGTCGWRRPLGLRANYGGSDRRRAARATAGTPSRRRDGGYGGYNQPPQGGGYGGYTQPPAETAGTGGYNQPPQGGSEPPTQQMPWNGGAAPGNDPSGGGYNQPPQGGSEPPTQQMPRNGEGWEPPAQPPR